MNRWLPRLVLGMILCTGLYGIAMAVQETYNAFIAASTAASPPYAATDYFNLVRGSATLRIPGNVLVDTTSGQTLSGKTISCASNTCTVRLNTSDVTGVNQLVNGGLGVSAAVSGGIPYGSSTSTIAFSAAGSANLPMIWGGAGVAPAAGIVTGNTTVFVTGTGTYPASQGYRTDTSGNAVTSAAAVFTDTGYTWTGTQTFAAVQGTQNNISTAINSYTILPTDCGKSLYFTQSGAVAVVVPASLALPNNGVGCLVAVEQGGTGILTVNAGSGASFDSAHGFTHTSGKFAIIGLYMDTNSGSNAHWVFTGDGA